jgi:hypothetical protein
MAFDNFTVNVVSFNETEGVDWTQSRPSVTLIITPNAGYAINVANFSPINPLPTYVDSVTFSQSGTNIECVILYTSPSVMPSNDVLIALCINGSATEIAYSVSGDVLGIQAGCNISNVIPTAYANQGNFNETKAVLYLTVRADTGYYFPEQPTLVLSVGSNSNYVISKTNVLDGSGNITETNFVVQYTFPNFSVTGNHLTLSACAAEIYSPSIEIQSYTMSFANVIVSGETRPITIYGITGAAWQLQVTESVGGTTIGQFSGTIDSSGSATESIVFPLSTVNVDYTFTLTGDLANTFCTVAPYIPCLTGQPSVWQIRQYTAQDVSFNLTSTFSSITIGATDTKSFTPLGTPGITAYSVSASKPGSSQDFIFNTPPTSTNWSNQNGTNPITNQTVQDPLLITINNASDPKTLVIDLDTNIAQVGTQPLLSVLNLDNFLLSYTELTLCYAVTETALCCGTSESRTVFVQGDAANLAGVTGDLYTDATFQTKAADGYYSDDPGISCSPSTLTAFNTSIGNPTGNCSTPQITPLYFQVISPATNQAPLIGDDVFTDTNGSKLNPTSTTMYYIASLTAYGVNLGVVVSIAPCTTPPTGISYTLQNGTNSDLTFSYTNTSGGFTTGLLGGFEGDTICAQANTVSADTGISVSTGSSC